jgi:hypothetical protein
MTLTKIAEITEVLTIGKRRALEKAAKHRYSLLIVIGVPGG